MNKLEDYKKILYNIPLEREYESWIVSGIEDYFEKIGVKVYCFCISPKLEKIIPVDDFLHFNGRLIGLQMKRPILDNGRIKWNLSKAQHKKIQNNQEIYYCLPTFINRDYRKNALHHCLFWRPEDSMNGMILWYNNNSRAKKLGFKDKARWGLFIESLLDGNIGRKIKSKSEMEGYFNEFGESGVILYIPEQENTP